MTVYVVVKRAILLFGGYIYILPLSVLLIEYLIYIVLVGQIAIE